VPVRAEPRDDAEQVTQLIAGEPVAVLETRDGWARIVTAYDYPGWAREEALRPTTGDEWLAVRKGDVLKEARAYLGAPYEWGGMTAEGIDCSGLIHMSFRRLGVLVPRDSWQQEAAWWPDKTFGPAISSATRAIPPSGSPPGGSCMPRGEKASRACSKRTNRMSFAQGFAATGVCNKTCFYLPLGG